jgi:hypothetical protein
VLQVILIVSAPLWGWVADRTGGEWVVAGAWWVVGVLWGVRQREVALHRRT